MKRIVFAGACLAAGALISTALVPGAAQAAPVADAAARTSAVTTGSLTDTSSAQQRWLSVADSRVVLNPYDFDAAGNGNSEISYTGGKNLPLATGFYAHDKALHVRESLTTYALGTNDQYALNESFDSKPSGWTTGNAEATYSGGKVTVKNSGEKWGYLATPSMSLNVSVFTKLKIKIDSTSPASVGKWALKVNTGGSDDLSPALQADTTNTGELTFDIGAYFAQKNLTGVQDVSFRIWATTYGTAEDTVSYTMDSFQIFRGSTPEDGQLVKYTTSWQSGHGWTSKDTNPATMADGGVLTRSGSNYGYAQKQITSVNLTQTPMVTVAVGSTTGKWALKVSDGGSDKTIQGDTASTGTFTYNIASLTGWSGSKDIWFKLFQITDSGKSSSSTTFARFSVHSGGDGTAVSAANSVAYSWTPASDTMTGTYGAGTITTTDYFSANQLDGAVRRIVPALTGGAAPIVAGVVESATASYDQATGVLTIPTTYGTRAVALPAGTSVSFYTSKAAFLSNSSPTAAPTSASAYWSASLSASSTSFVGLGFSVNSGTNTELGVTWTNPYPGGPAAEAAAIATSSRDEGAAGIAHWTDHWDTYVASVPVVEDFSIQRVAAGGVTADQMEAFYYKAFLNLEMNVLPATPETGNMYRQVGTGKPSLWMHGTPGTRNVASWDSLLGMQQLAYTNADASWDSFIGMMKSVQMSGDAPTDTNGVSAKGALKGESLPSRKAQTAWILYSVSGDETKLNSIYDELYANLIWSSHNMRWIYSSNNYTDERDSEFVASLIYDLKFGIKVAQTLGKSADAAQFESMITDLTRDYEAWFFPTTSTTDSKGNPVTWTTVQKIYLTHLKGAQGCPWSDGSEGADYYNSAGQCVKAGWSFYTSTALIADQLSPEYKAKVLDRFLRDYKAGSQLAGLGSFAVKAPDIQLITYGLFDELGWSGGSNSAGYTWSTVTRSALIDMGTVLVNSFNRDMVKSGFFAEVYYQTGDGTDVSAAIGSRGVRPSLFGVSHYIDNIWIANGYRVDEGNPTFIRTQGATGGISGLTYMGKTFNLDISGNSINLTGKAVGGSVGLPRSVDVSQTGIPAQPEVSPQEPGTQSGDATLASLTYGGAPVPGFNAATTTYAVELPAGTTTAPTVAATPTDAKATAHIQQATSLPGTATVKVTAEDNTTATYTVAFTVAANPGTQSGDATLASLTYGGAPVPGFNAATTTYAVELPAGTTTAPTVAATPTDAKATAHIQQATSLPGTATVTVTAEDNTTATYTVAFTVAANPGAPTDPVPTTTTAPAAVSATYGTPARIAVAVHAGSKTATGTVTARQGSKLLGSATLQAGKANLVLDKTLSAGTHAVTLTFVPADAKAFAGSTAATRVTVAKARTKMAAAKITRGKAGKKGKAARSIKRTKKSTIKVTLRSVSGIAPTGTVTLKAGKRKLGKARIKVTAAGVATATIKVSKKSAKKIKKKTAIKAVYGGNANIAKATLKTGLRVIR
ncbi:Ig-like domain-containing protein [Rarobacter incanus]|uniref:Ig-like domain-containing protein n=1 Tax=Rarobacter incanus TaxID=153494 RepID=A0A542SQU3_9MICO|nr:Ig-like domain-containing protein [Rarobacter incanus]TQK76567.1 Ig-like domain-containing protein [Rarobacter incanus]